MRRSADGGIPTYPHAMSSPRPTAPHSTAAAPAGSGLRVSARPQITELIGIYHADGGVLGEAKYIVGKLLGTAHCALCDITHSPVRRKPAWDAMVARLGVPFRLHHLNEMPIDIAAAVSEADPPTVMARLDNGTLAVALDRHTLERLGGSVAEFHTALIRSVSLQGWRIKGEV